MFVKDGDRCSEKESRDCNALSVPRNSVLTAPSSLHQGAISSRAAWRTDVDASLKGQIGDCSSSSHLSDRNF